MYVKDIQIKKKRKINNKNFEKGCSKASKMAIFDRKSEFFDKKHL